MNKKDLLVIILIFTATFGAFAAYSFFLPFFPLAGDTDYYDGIALNLKQGAGFSWQGKPTAVVAPGYPFFLFLVYSAFGHNYTAVRFLQFLILGLTGVIAYFIAKNQLKLPFAASLFCGLVILFWPYLVLYATLLLTEILFIFLLLLSVYFLLKFFQKTTWLIAFAAGAVLGLAMLVRPVIILLPFWLALFLFLLTPLEMSFLTGLKRNAWQKIALFLLAVLLIISPWMVRNFLVFGKFIPLTTNLSPTISRAFLAYDYTEGSRALEAGQADLKLFLLSRLKNIYLFWNPGAEGERASFLLNKSPLFSYLFLAYKIAFFLILALAFLSLKLSLQRKKILLLWLIIFYFWAFHTLFYPYPRYTLPIMPLVILLACCVISALQKLQLTNSRG